VGVTQRQRAYWRTNLALVASLLLVWFVVTFVVSFFARELSFRFFGWPFSFWMGAQGALLVYGAIIWFYARTMDRLDAHYAMQAHERDDVHTDDV
jgi:putative solute:sodium symporter small subunit